MAWAAVALLCLLLGACSSDSGGGSAADGSGASTTVVDGSTTTTSTSTPSGDDGDATAPEPSAEAAVTAMLTALQAGDPVASYRLLSDDGRRDYPTQLDWDQRVTELAPITEFTIEDRSFEQVRALVSHEPGLDPFLGLTAAQERQTWTAVEVDGGWLVTPEPDIDYVLPSDEDASAAALAWATAVQACDEPGAASLQAIDQIFNSSTQVADLCGAEGPLTTGAVGELPPGPASGDIVAQYSSDALIWGRTVPITFGDNTVTVLLAPIGDVWKVMGVSD